MRKYDLPNNLTATVEIIKYGQEEIHLGDKMEVMARLSLPAKDESLHESLRFGERLKIAKQPLTAEWGDYQDGHMVCAPIFCGETYELAELDAIEWCDHKMITLITMMNKRNLIQPK